MGRTAKCRPSLAFRPSYTAASMTCPPIPFGGKPKAAVRRIATVRWIHSRLPLAVKHNTVHFSRGIGILPVMLALHLGVPSSSPTRYDRLEAYPTTDRPKI